MDASTVAPFPDERESGGVAAFYRGRSVLVTGASGFMGKVLVEKLLRSCPEVREVLVLLRPKTVRGVQLAVDERLQRLLAAPVFNALRSGRPEALSKVQAVVGDVCLPGLGLSARERARLCADVSVVFHVAASVRFSEHLKLAFQINVLGTRAVLDLCRDMPGLAALVHISTAFCNCARKEVIGEVVYPAPTTAAGLQAELDRRDEKQVKDDTASLIGEYPNTYTLTKAIAEEVVKEEGVGLPVVIIRPSIVCPAVREPFPGWGDSVNGPVGPWIAIGKGTLSCVFGDADVVADLVPVDVCINLMVASAWSCAAPTAAPTVYNCVSGASSPVTWGRATALWVEAVRRRPYASTLWLPSASFTTSRLYHRLCTALGKSLPAQLFDLAALAAGRKNPRMAAQVSKQMRMMQPLDFFTTHQWSFKNDNVRSLWAAMSARDRQAFPFDVSTLDWKEYLEAILSGTKDYILKEQGSENPELQSRLRRMDALYRLVVVLSIPLLVMLLAQPLFSKL
ncbi:Putative fatty acyl-CoA reductase [Frankliniella fusca]|uniref:Fatty acyl-CoA reductase n=1 Tax=Frankliniella fusca TaxID=407009 RepID=A0AAE1LDW7_9NEOP|nr:Putative fatty acyl-CoA reductase [Frankliniella fusca]